MTAQRSDPKNVLQQGIAAAKAGQPARAREYLTRAVKLEPCNVQAWLWLSAVLEAPEARERCLERVLSLDPTQAQARRGLAVVRQEVTGTLLQQAITLVEAGQREAAREVLTKVVERDEENVTAWTWLSRVVDSPEDQEVCFENILALDPDNRDVAARLDVLRQAREVADTSLWQAPAPEEAAATARAAPTLAGEVLGDDYVARHTTVIPEDAPAPESPVTALWAAYEDELLCPYCAAPTEFEDRVCARCGNKLWLKFRRREEHSFLLWVLILFQVLSTLLTALGPVVVLYIASWQIGYRDFHLLFPVYFGLPGQVSPEVAEAALGIVPRFVFYLSWIPFVISSALTVALYVRWPPVYYLMLGNAVLGLLGSVLGLVFNLSQGALAVVFAGIGALSSMFTFGLVLQLGDDFKMDRRRMLLQVDQGITSGMAYLLRGRQYAAGKMWALAALHFRRAAGLMPYQTDAYIATAIACVHLKANMLARHALQQARDSNPNDAQIAEVMKLLEEDDDT